MYNYRMVQADKLDFVPVASTAEIPPGQRMLLDVGDISLAVFNIAGKYFAIADICSHDGGPLAEGEIDGDVIECPRHGAQFNVKTGEVVAMPAVVPISTYPVKMEGDQIIVTLEG